MSKLDDARLSCITESDVVIAIVGGTGTGKSMFINVATGDLPNSVVHILDSGLKGLQAVRFTHPRFRRSIIFLDTPGLNDTSGSGKTPWMLVHTWMQQQYQGRVKLSGVVFLHRITDNRLDASSLAALPMLLTLCEDGPHNTLLVTTMWSSFQNRLERFREKELRAIHWRSMIDRGAHAVRFDGTFESAWQIINKVLKAARQRSIAMREEMVELRHALAALKGGLKVYHTLQTLLVEQREITNLLKDAIAQDDSLSIRDLHAHLARNDVKLIKTFADIRHANIAIGSVAGGLCPQGGFMKSSFSV